jgi:thioredoxin-related protein
MPRLITSYVSFISFIFVASLFCSVALAVDLEMADDDAYVEPALVLPVAEDLEALGGSSRDAMVPILIMYSTEDCVFCARLESEVLGPMRLSGADPTRVIVRKVLMEDYETLRDFNGKERDAESYAIERGVEVVPTVVLVDEDGNELVPKIVGYQTPGIYDAYLDKAIEVSQILLKQR